MTTIRHSAFVISAFSKSVSIRVNPWLKNYLNFFSRSFSTNATNFTAWSFNRLSYSG